QPVFLRLPPVFLQLYPPVSSPPGDAQALLLPDVCLLPDVSVCFCRRRLRSAHGIRGLYFFSFWERLLFLYPASMLPLFLLFWNFPLWRSAPFPSVKIFLLSF